MEESDLFEKAAAHMPSLVSQLAEEELLHLYARYKQATVGSCKTSKPGFLDFQGKKKWNAWKSLGDMPSDQARAEYVKMIKKCDPEWDSEKTDGSKKSIFGGVTVSRMAVEEDGPRGERNKFDLCKEGLLKELENCFGGNDICLKDESQRTLLHWACDRGHIDIVKFLLDHHIDINSQDEDALTPLHYAVQCGYLQIVKLLIDRGADLSLTDSDGDRPIDCADNNDIRSVLINVSPSC